MNTFTITFAKMGVSLLALSFLLVSCGSHQGVQSDLTKNDNIETIFNENGSVSFYDTETGEMTAKNLIIDWTQNSPHDSLSVFCSQDLRGYFSAYSGRVVIPAQYRRAWIFSEGLAAVQKDDRIGFINHQGETVIDFIFSYYGNPLTDFVFHNGVCVVANNEGKCGVIDKTGRWLILPEWDYVAAFKEYAVVTAEGVRKQMTYDGQVMNSFVVEDVQELTYIREEYSQYVVGHMEEKNMIYYTGLYAYRVGGRWGLMDSQCNRLTEPLYADITAVGNNIFRAELLDGFSEVILNSKGEVMNRFP